MTNGYNGLAAPRERREPGAPPMRARSVKLTDAEWADICAQAAAENTSASAVLRRAWAQYRDAPAVIA